MKMKSVPAGLRSSLLAAVLTVTCIATYGQDPPKPADPADAVPTIKRFYTEYIGQWLSDGTDFAAGIGAVMERYISPELLDKLQKAGLDYDPFLQAQDCDRSMLDKLTVEPCDDRDNAYTVGLWDSFNSRYGTIVLTVDADGMIADISSALQ